MPITLPSSRPVKQHSALGFVRDLNGIVRDHKKTYTRIRLSAAPAKASIGISSGISFLSTPDTSETPVP